MRRTYERVTDTIIMTLLSNQKNNYNLDFQDANTVWITVNRLFDTIVSLQCAKLRNIYFTIYHKAILI